MTNGIDEASSRVLLSDFGSVDLRATAIHVNQIQRIVFENKFFLFRRNIRPLADAAHGFRKRGIEVRVVRRHDDVGLADFGERQAAAIFRRLRK